MKEKKSRGLDNKRILGDQTIVLSVRLKPSTIGNIARFLDDNGIRVLSAAGLLRDALEIMEQNAKVEKFTSEREALEYLESMGILHTDYMSKSNTKKVAQCLALENVKLERKLTGSVDFQKTVLEATRRFNESLSQPDNDEDKNAGAIITLLPKG